MIADNILQRAITRLVGRGTLRIITGSGACLEAGDSGDPHVSIRLIGRTATWSLLIDPELTLGELYTNGRLVIEQGTIFDLFQLLLETRHGQRGALPIPSFSSLRELAERFRGKIDPNRAKRNVAHHYDLDRRLYELFLDSDWQYSCAYFEYPGQSLDDAQRAKQRHIAAKLMIEPGQEVLDIGSGWGGLALYLARSAGAGKVKGITLSEEQLAGIGHVGALETVGLAEMQRVLDVNLRSVLVASRAAITHLSAGGRIINIGSNLADRVPFAGVTLYAMTKSALTGFTKGLARDLGPRDITVNLVHPGPTDTDMNPAAGPNGDFLRAAIPLGRFGSPHDVAAMVAFLVSPEAGQVTGACFAVDGGINA